MSKKDNKIMLVLEHFLSLHEADQIYSLVINKRIKTELVKLKLGEVSPLRPPVPYPVRRKIKVVLEKFLPPFEAEHLILDIFNESVSEDAIRENTKTFMAEQKRIIEASTKNAYNTSPLNMKVGDRFGYKVIAVIQHPDMWSAYRGLTSETDEEIARHGDKISYAAAQALFPTIAGNFLWNV